jgi:hypothetical protein
MAISIELIFNKIKILLLANIMPKSLEFFYQLDNSYAV